MFSDKRAWAALVVCVVVGAGCSGKQQEPEAKVSFQADVKPILDKHCLQCHQPGGDGYKQSELGMESYASLMKGTKYGAVIVPGSSVSSTLVRLVEGKADPSIAMPHGQAPLSKQEIEVIAKWVDQGAIDN